MKRLKQKRYKKYKHLIKDATAKALKRSSERAKQQLKRQGAVRLLRDMIKAEQELGESL